jgi:hypothetical protein
LQQAVAEDGPKVSIEIGQPSVWSLGQAHYLLAKVHRRNRKLSTRFPDEEALDSNRISATRIEALRQSLGVEAQFDQAMKVRNDIAMQRFREGEVRREAARTDLRSRQAELQQANTEIAALEDEIVLLEEDDRQSTEARGRSTPPAPPSVEDNERKRQLVLLRVRKTRKEREREELKSQVATLTTTVDTPTATPTFEEPALTTGAGSLPNPATFQKFMDKALAEAGKPDLTASMKLDNFVQMQYEIIAKQLTLLRDEVGPDDRVIFLELPASIYTVDKKADNYIAQAEWEVIRYYDREPSEEIQAEVIIETLRNEGKTEKEIRQTLLHIENVRNFAIKYEAQARLMQDSGVQKQLNSVKAELAQAKVSDDKIKEALAAKEAALLPDFVDEVQKEIDEDKYGSPRPYPITLEMIRRAANGADDAAKGKGAAQLAFTNDGNKETPCPGQTIQEKRNKKTEGGNGELEGEGNPSRSPCKYNVRAIDIIPRQSALNVNEYHATVKETMFLAAFKFLIGFAGKVNFQRQRELYEQFVQQEVFASGYGKGGNKFGWTYGPQPGTKRIKTGQRTSFAVLVVPRNTLAIQLKGRGRFFKRDESPLDKDDDVKSTGEVNYLLSVPGQKTQEFWVDSISYTPVKKGKRVTTIVEGDFFSPQLGVLVNGVPLEPTLSISRIAGSDEEVDVTSADGVSGEYEITNSRQIILSFTMGDSYVGTPNITFVTPEKTTALNFFDLDVNHRGLTSLQEHSVREPMFIGEFSVKEKLEGLKLGDVCEGLDANTKYLGLARLRGEGLRPSAEILVNGAIEASDNKLRFRSIKNICARIIAEPSKPFVAQESTNSYILYAKGIGDPQRKIRYRQLTRQGYEEKEFGEDLRRPAVEHSVRNYLFNPAMRRGEVDLSFSPTTKETTITEITLDEPEVRNGCPSLKRAGDEYRVKCYVPAANGGKLERDFITVKITLRSVDEYQVEKFEDKYLDIRLPVRPILYSIVNPRTGKAEGYADEEPTIVISGINLQGVTGVLFGDKKVDVVGASADSIAIKVPKGAAVPKGQAAAVPIILQTRGGQLPTGAVYTYLGEPVPPNIIVWPPPPYGKQP